MKLLQTAAMVAATLAAGAAQAQVLNLYSARHYQTDQALYDNFTKQTGIKINRIEAGENELLERIRNEGANSPADVLLTVDAARLAKADELQLFAPVKSALLESRVPANLRTADWYAGAHPYNLSLGAAMYERGGEQKVFDWAKGLVANFARAPKGGDTDQIKAVAAGECGVALANSYYVARLMRSDKPEDKKLMESVSVVWPNQKGEGTHVNISGAGVLKTAPNKEAAVKFLEYLASDSAQVYFADGNNEWPVVAGVKTANPALAKLGSFKQDNISVGKLAKHQAAVQKIYDRAGWQ